jgi:hypothetical protein
MKSNVEVSIWLSNIDPPRCLRLFEATAVETIITTQCIHHIPVRGWCWKVVNVTHADCVCVWGGGGVTNGQWSFFIYRPGPEFTLPPLKKIPGQDLAVLFKHTSPGKPCP